MSAKQMNVMRVGLMGRLLLVAGAMWSLLMIGCAPVGAPYAAPASSPMMEAEGSVASAGDEAVARNSVGALRRKSASAMAPERSIAPAPQRPGLGTGWGRSVRSELGHTSYNRASSKPQAGVAMIYYNDREGVNAMTGWKQSSARMQAAAGGLVEWGVSTGSGLMRNYYGSGRRFVVGKKGQDYTLVVKNLAKTRLEMVLSVDGLDVMDGKTASVRKRGYIVDPGETLKVRGWRTSTARVAAFEFSGVADSYANLRHGETRNVGVIGLAVFTEKGVDPWRWMPREVQNRKSASPFAEAPVYGVR